MPLDVKLRIPILDDIYQNGTAQKCHNSARNRFLNKKHF